MITVQNENLPCGKCCDIGEPTLGGWGRLFEQFTEQQEGAIIQLVTSFYNVDETNEDEMADAISKSCNMLGPLIRTAPYLVGAFVRETTYSPKSRSPIFASSSECADSISIEDAEFVFQKLRDSGSFAAIVKRVGNWLRGSVQKMRDMKQVPPASESQTP